MPYHQLQHARSDIVSWSGLQAFAKNKYGNRGETNETQKNKKKNKCNQKEELLLQGNKQH